MKSKERKKLPNENLGEGLPKKRSTPKDPTNFITVWVSEHVYGRVGEGGQVLTNFC